MGPLIPINKFRRNFRPNSRLPAGQAKPIRAHRQQNNKVQIEFVLYKNKTKVTTAVINRIFSDIYEIDMPTCLTFFLITFLDKSTSTYLSEMTCINDPKKKTVSM